MRISELLRLVWININQNRFKTIMTSIGIVVGAATIVMVIAIGRGGQMDVAEQFSSLNAGAIDVSYEYEGEDSSSGGFSFGGAVGNFFGEMSQMFGGGSGGSDNGSGGMPSGGSDNGSGGMPSGGGSDSGSGGMPSGGGSDNGSGGMPSGGGSDNGSGGMPSGGSDNGSGGMPSDGSSDNGSGDGASGGPSDIRSDGMTGNPDGQADSSDAASAEQAEDETADLSDAAGASGDDTTNEDEDDEEEDALSSRMNQEEIILTEEDVEDILTFVTGIEDATITYTTRASVEGGNLTSGETYTLAGVKENYASLSNLVMADGEFLTEEDDEAGSRVCVLGSSVAKELFGSAADVVGSTIYIDDRTYTVIGVLSATQTVSAGISPDDTILIPYETGIKYITGKSVSPTITVIAEDVTDVSRVEADIQTVLSDNYDNTEFTFEDAGSKMEAAEASNRTLTMLLTAMACIVFIVGGIGIMNVLFVSVKERTNEIGILKALGASQGNILFEFLVESAAISLIGGILGVALSFAITPLVEYYGMRVEANLTAWASALGFAVLTGTLFGFYPAWKASRLVPVDALQAE